MAERILRVADIEQQPKRKLLYGDTRRSDPFRYKVIAKPEEQVEIGDVIKYEPYGANFGWFIGIAHKVTDSKQQE